MYNKNTDMGIFWNITPTDNRPEFVGLPVEDIKSMNATLDATYKENQATYDKLEIAMANMPAEARNNPIMEKKMAELRAGMQGAIDNGNIELAGPLIKQSIKKFATDKEIQGVQKSFALQQDFVKRIDDLEDVYIKSDGKDGGISPKQAMIYRKQAALGNYQPISYDAENGFQNMFSAPTVNKYVDIDGRVRDVIGDMKASCYSTN